MGEGQEDGGGHGPATIGIVVVAAVVAAVLTIVWRRDPAEWPDDIVTVAGLEVGDDTVDGVPLRPGTFDVDVGLADGLWVPTGTVLLGDVLPTDRAQPDRARPGSGWRAYLLVVGGADDAVADLADQAGTAGLAPEAGGGCRARGGDWEPGARACAFAWGAPGGRRLTAELTRGTRVDGGASVPASLLRLTLLDRAPASGPPPEPAAGTGTPEPAVPDDPRPGGWADPPEAGERLGADDGAGAGALAGLRLPDGADAVVAPWPAGDGGTGYGAIAELTGDVAATLADLAAQLADLAPPTDGTTDGATGGPADGTTGRTTGGAGAEPGDGPVRPERATLPGGSLVRLTASGPGGDAYVLTATTVDDRTWLTIEPSDGP